MPIRRPNLAAKLNRSLRGVPVSKLARTSGFCRRKARKVGPRAFIQAICLTVLCASPSLQAAAVFASLWGESVVSRQGIWKRIGPRSARFLRGATLALLAVQSHARRLARAGVFAPFRRVLIEDSTVLPLAPSLAKAFPGGANQSGKKSAAVKIQAVYDLLAGRFLRFALAAFTRNDQAAAGDILSLLRPGDLLLRDLGFFALPVFRSIGQKGAFFLSRLRQQVWIGTPDGRTLTLLAHLRRHGQFDGPVLLGSQEKLPVRLVAVRVSAATAAERRRRRLQNRDRRLRPTRERLALLGWALMITNVPPEVWDAPTVCKVYRVRWRIEILFKAWKSRFHFAALPAGSAAYIETLLWARLLLVTITCPLFEDAFGRPVRTRSAPRSVLKAAPILLLALICVWLRRAHHAAERLDEILQRLGSYDKRRDRSCFPLFVQTLG